MRRFTTVFILILQVFVARESLAQGSCVFLPECSNIPSGFDRPRPRLQKLRTFSVPHSQSLVVNSAPDFPNINVSSYLLADQDETSIAINPVNPANILIGANDYRSDTSLFHFESFDGGLTWHFGSLDAAWDFAANPTDPAVAFNSAGKGFYSYGRTAQDIQPINDVICNTTINGGADWNLPVRISLDSTGYHLATTFADKYYIATDNESQSPFKDRVYETWAEYDLSKKNRLRVSYSTDDGVTWSLPSYLTASGNCQSPIPTAGVHGELYVAYENIDPSQHEVRCAISTDGGKTFPTDRLISGYTDLGPMFPPGDPAAHPSIKGGLRVNSFPSIAVDHSALHHGRIYMTWAAKGADNRHHIFLAMSDDAGNSWSTPSAVENDNSPVATDKFFPWIAVDDVTGDIGIAFYDSRSDTANILVDLYMLFSKDGGQSFSIERITSASSDVTASSSGLTNFFGDYNGLAAHNKIWYPSWTDSRVGYDQDIYTAIVRPHAPSAPRNFIASEDSITHLPDLSWEYSSATTFGAALGDYVFRLKRSDGGLSVDLPKTTRTYADLSAIKNTDYTYWLQVLSSGNDTSVRQIANFSPRANREPLPPTITSAKAMPGGVQIFFRVPDLNRAGTTIHDLSRIYYLVNGNVRDSSLVTDASLGKIFNYTFFNLQPEGYYLIQLAASTKNNDGDTTLSTLSDPVWLYAGAPLDSYSEDFDASRNIFSPFSWDTTRASGKLPGNYLNDSLPDIRYRNNVDSWFLLPPVKITAGVQSLEFSHIALVAQGDSAIIEVSTDDGVSFSRYAAYDKTSNASDWGSDLSSSKPAHEVIGLRHLIGQDAIARFRLLTHSTNGDGWFIDSIHYTSKLSVGTSKHMSTLKVTLVDNPARLGLQEKMILTCEKQIDITVNLYSILGVKIGTLLNGKPISPGEYQLEFSAEQAGPCFYEVIGRSADAQERKYGKFIVLP